MNLSIIIGMVLAAALVVFGILQEGSLGSFIDASSILITVGGTIAALIASFPLKDFAQLPKHVLIILRQKSDPVFYINTLTDLSQEARKKGLLALEDQVAEFSDAFLKDSVMLIVDAMEPDKVREQLEGEIANIEARHSRAWNLYDKGATLAPGFGMIGTLIGLVNMLANMNFSEEGGADQLAASMAIALITTFYGSLMANAIFIPVGNQLRLKHEEEMLCKEIIVEGIISIQAGENPRHINEKLMAYLTHKQREKALAGKGGAASEE